MTVIIVDAFVVGTRCICGFGRDSSVYTHRHVFKDNMLEVRVKAGLLRHHGQVKKRSHRDHDQMSLWPRLRQAKPRTFTERKSRLTFQSKADHTQTQYTGTLCTTIGLPPLICHPKSAPWSATLGPPRSVPWTATVSVTISHATCPDKPQ